MKFLETIISKVKGENYTISDNIKIIDVSTILFTKSIQIIRGKFLSILFKNKKGLIFIGKKVRIRHPWNISCGKSCILDDYVFINGLIRQHIKLGNNVTIGRNTIIDCTGVLNELGEEINIGNSVGISPNCFLGVRGTINIGDNTIIGPYVSVHAENHVYSNTDVPIRLQGTIRKGVKIGKDCWIGAKSTILDCVTIGNGAAGSVVNKDIPDMMVVGGVPARIIKERI